MDERGPFTGHRSKTVQQRREPAVCVEAFNTVAADVCGLFRVILDAEWQKLPTLPREIEHAIRTVLQRRAFRLDASVGHSVPAVTGYRNR
jgi:hypothetical protein